MNIKISPSILGADYGVLREASAEAERQGACAIHVDLMDGHYVHNFSFGMDLFPALKKHLTVPLVAHLEVANPVPFSEDFAAAGANYLIAGSSVFCGDIGENMRALEHAAETTGA